MISKVDFMKFVKVLNVRLDEELIFFKNKGKF